MRRSPLAYLLLGLVQLYRWTLSPLMGPKCRHLPTCSDYALQAVRLHGGWRGGWLALSRLARCHPWGSHGFDPVPEVLEDQPAWAPWRYGRWSRSVCHSVPDKKELPVSH
ncbi:MAG: membrane protein insertion efficiency factor YidD [Parvibaculaceae bacterium]|nr:membrane protein insertion efficiency factor YidD [Kangiella sp.]